MSFPVFCARVRMPVCAGAAVSIVLGVAISVSWLYWLGFGLLVIGLGLYFRVGTLRGAPIEVQAPVTGRWLAINSPATRVPSHGTHAYGQTYAIDLVHEPADGTRPGFGWWPPFRRPEVFSGYGQPVLAPADARVVRVHERERDHRSRNSVPGIAYLFVEAAVRELFGPNRILGNNLVLDLGDGAYVVLAHLQRGSVRVRVGERVAAGQHLGDCGNSGNSTEPHLHIHLMDHPRALVAAGLPVRFRQFEVDGEIHAGMPENGQIFTVDTASADR